ncbi:MAG: hypothetical protein AAGH60_02125 [Pseudomonadota bacterium]
MTDATVIPASGSRFYIGSAPIADKDTDFVEADFNSVTWLEVDPLQTIGTLGDEVTEGTFDVLNRRRTVVYKGQKRAPNIEVTAALDPSNSGQAKLYEALASDSNYPWRVAYPDTPATGAAPTPSMRMGIGMVMSAQEEVAGANDALILRSIIAPNSNVVRVAAATGD